MHEMRPIYEMRPICFMLRTVSCRPTITRINTTLIITSFNLTLYYMIPFAQTTKKGMIITELTCIRLIITT